jgi:hypothetical protein
VAAHLKRRRSKVWTESDTAPLHGEPRPAAPTPGASRLRQPQYLLLRVLPLALVVVLVILAALFPEAVRHVIALLALLQRLPPPPAL